MTGVSKLMYRDKRVIYRWIRNFSQKTPVLNKAQVLQKIFIFKVSVHFSYKLYPHKNWILKVQIGHCIWKQSCKTNIIQIGVCCVKFERVVFKMMLRNCDCSLEAQFFKWPRQGRQFFQSRHFRFCPKCEFLENYKLCDHFF